MEKNNYRIFNFILVICIDLFINKFLIIINFYKYNYINK